MIFQFLFIRGRSEEIIDILKKNYQYEINIIYIIHYTGQPEYLHSIFKEKWSNIILMNMKNNYYVISQSVIPPVIIDKSINFVITNENIVCSQDEQVHLGYNTVVSRPFYIKC